MEKIWLKHYPPGVPREVDYGQYRSIGELFDTITVFENYPAAAGAVGAEFGGVRMVGGSGFDGTHYPLSLIVVPGDRLHLRLFKEDVKEVREGFECGLKVHGYDDVKVDDVIEAYRIEQVQRTLS